MPLTLPRCRSVIYTAVLGAGAQALTATMLSITFCYYFLRDYAEYFGLQVVGGCLLMILEQLLSGAFVGATLGQLILLARSKV